MSTVVAGEAQVDLDAFVAREYPKVVAAVGLITGSPQDAADAVQDALVGFLAKPPSRPVENLAAWITVVASNRARDLRRSRDAESRALHRIGARVEAATAVGPVTGASDAVDVDVARALAALPDRQRQVCVLHYLLDQPVEQIAAGLGVSTGTVKTQLFRARKALAARLRKEDHRG
ncbi:RNA polymerase sigma factor [Antribacter gilvus]|uniref:RNA polymerase sigma factor n=1 Tax=Antribacter gilvus TaxID=2304675 RepID=UPI0013E05A16|nr:RNA polymerase sigma factor [Antribacter gilvus]